MNQTDRQIDQQFHLLYQARDLHYQLDRCKHTAKMELFPSNTYAKLQQEFFGTVRQLLNTGMDLAEVTEELNFLTLN